MRKLVAATAVAVTVVVTVVDQTTNAILGAVGERIVQLANRIDKHVD